MPNTQDTCAVIGATRIAIPVLGASNFPFKITAPAFATDGSLRWISGGSLEIFPNVSFSGATAGGLGYVLGTAEVFAFDGPASFYVAASGSTCVFGIHWHLTSGATIG